jgi:hypothetical protein
MLVSKIGRMRARSVAANRCCSTILSSVQPRQGYRVGLAYV